MRNAKSAFPVIGPSYLSPVLEVKTASALGQLCDVALFHSGNVFIEHRAELNYLQVVDMLSNALIERVYQPAS